MKAKFKEEIPVELTTSKIKTSKELRNSLAQIPYNSTELKKFAYLTPSEQSRLEGLIKDDPETTETFNKAMEDAHNFRQSDIAKQKLCAVLNKILPGLIATGSFTFYININDYFEDDDDLVQLADLPEKDKNTLKNEMDDEEKNLFDSMVAHGQHLKQQAHNALINPEESLALQHCPDTPVPFELENSLKVQPTIVEVQTSATEDIINHFNKAYANKKTEYPDYQEPKIDPTNGLLTLKFPSNANKDAFFKEQAMNKIPFVTVDNKTQEVMAISTGDGNLYKPDGTLFGENERMIPTGIKYDAHYQLPASLHPNASSSEEDGATDVFSP